MLHSALPRAFVAERYSKVGLEGGSIAISPAESPSAAIKVVTSSLATVRSIVVVFLLLRSMLQSQEFGLICCQAESKGRFRDGRGDGHLRCRLMLRKYETEEGS